MSALEWYADGDGAYADEPLRDTRHLTARSAQEFLAWQEWLELGGFGSCDAYKRTAAVLMNLYPDRAFNEFGEDDLITCLLTFPVKSRRVRKAHLNNWFAWGLRKRHVTGLKVNPVSYLPAMKQHAQPIIDVFSEAEQLRLEALPLPDGPLMTLLFETGLRREEACQMRVERIDFDAGMVMVKEGAKGGKERLVPIVPSLAMAMDFLISDARLKPSDYLWYDKPGGSFATQLRRSQPIAPTSFGRWWYRCLDDARVAYIKRNPKAGITGHGNPHCARHTFATRWRMRGLALDDLQKILGHASVKTTSDLYVHTGTRVIGDRMRDLLKAKV
jgi:integrase